MDTKTTEAIIALVKRIEEVVDRKIGTPAWKARIQAEVLELGEILQGEPYIDSSVFEAMSPSMRLIALGGWSLVFLKTLEEDVL